MRKITFPRKSRVKRIDDLQTFGRNMFQIAEELMVDLKSARSNRGQIRYYQLQSQEGYRQARVLMGVE